jgi:hypothetical protein
MVLDHLLPSVELNSFFEWTVQVLSSLVAFYNILLEEHQVAFEMLEVGICSLVSKLTTVIQ